MSNILITGATGNVGFEVIQSLSKIDSSNRLIAGVRNVDKAKIVFKDYPKLDYVYFDFEEADSFDNALTNIDRIFLLRPPHISDIDTYFKPLIQKIAEKNINQVVFLSVQGAEKSKIIPHNKIERLIQEFKFNYIFVRPSYFMQNLTTTLLTEIVKCRRITLPSGKARFNWIDVNNIGEASASLILDFEKYQNQAYEITGTENINFTEAAKLMSEITGESIVFKNVNPLRFYFKKKNEGMKSAFALVMTILHFLPRFQSEPDISKNYEKLTGKTPTTLREFIKREKEKLTGSHENL